MLQQRSCIGELVSDLVMGDACSLTPNVVWWCPDYAAVAFQDYNIGQILGTLDTLGQTQSTVVVVFGDHGWYARPT